MCSFFFQHLCSLLSSSVAAPAPAPAGSAPAVSSVAAANSDEQTTEPEAEAEADDDEATTEPEEDGGGDEVLFASERHFGCKLGRTLHLYDFVKMLFEQKKRWQN